MRNIHVIAALAALVLGAAAPAHSLTVSPFVIDTPPTGSIIAPTINGTVGGFDFTARGINTPIAGGGSTFADVGFIRGPDVTQPGFGVVGVPGNFVVNADATTRELIRFTFAEPIRLIAIGFATLADEVGEAAALTGSDNVAVNRPGEPLIRFNAPVDNPLVVDLVGSEFNVIAPNNGDSFRITGLAVRAAPVPLPLPVLFAATAFGGLFVMARRRRTAIA